MRPARICWNVAEADATLSKGWHGIKRSGDRFSRFRVLKIADKIELQLIRALMFSQAAAYSALLLYNSFIQWGSRPKWSGMLFRTVVPEIMRRTFRSFPNVHAMGGRVIE